MTMGFLSGIYQGIIRARNSLYDRGVFKAYLAPCLVISVGNIETGGTGKTPLILELAHALEKRDYNTAIVTRGYKGRIRGVHLVSPNDSPAEVGDEAVMMARSTTIPIIKSPDRLKGALYASRQFGCDICLLDDGFQHRRIFRDLDIVLVSSQICNKKMLPAGDLREPEDALKRADIIVHTKANTSGEIFARMIPSELKTVGSGAQTFSCLDGASVLAFCAVARPLVFFDSLRAMGAEVDTMAFSDHHAYTPRDIRRIKKRAEKKDWIITTDKDMVKIRPEWTDNKWLCLGVRMEIQGIENIIQRIEAIAHDRRISRQG